MKTNELTAAVMTPAGRGAIATVRVCGELSQLDASPEPLFAAANGRPISGQTINRIAFGRWGHSPGEDLVICRTADDELAIHCHGGIAAVRRVLEDLAQAGCRVIDWREQMSLRVERLEVECLDVLSRATTIRTAMILHEQSSGLLRSEFEKLRGMDTREERLRRVNSLLEWSSFGLHLASPWIVVLTGRPNVGKSSLINRLLGYERAIVFDQPGTTRDVVTGETAFDGWPVRLCDTAGLRDAPDEQPEFCEAIREGHSVVPANDPKWELEAAGIALARDALRTADLRLLLIDLGERPTVEDQQLLREMPDAIIIAHKSDKSDQWQSNCPSSAIRVSSTTGDGLDQLQRELIRRLVPRTPPIGTAIPVTARQNSILESIREVVSDRSIDDSVSLQRCDEYASNLIGRPV